LSPAGAERRLTLKKYTLNTNVSRANNSVNASAKFDGLKSPLFPSVFSLFCLFKCFVASVPPGAPPPLDPLPSTSHAPSSSPPYSYSRCHHQLPVNRFRLSPRGSSFQCSLRATATVARSVYSSGSVHTRTRGVYRLLPDSLATRLDSCTKPMALIHRSSARPCSYPPKYGTWSMRNTTRNRKLNSQPAAALSAQYHKYYHEAQLPVILLPFL
jgi:hypothetical protein